MHCHSIRNSNFRIPAIPLPRLMKTPEDSFQGYIRLQAGTDSQAPMLQLPHVTMETVKRLSRKKVRGLSHLVEMSAQERLEALTSSGLSTIHWSPIFKYNLHSVGPACSRSLLEGLLSRIDSSAMPRLCGCGYNCRLPQADCSVAIVLAL